ncbi:hypothetical protein EDM60_25000 [Brevibacillus parabrevis]|nr:hypothetical protein EDM60_25000 [Brevibacillus parabrevis]
MIQQSCFMNVALTPSTITCFLQRQNGKMSTNRQIRYLDIKIFLWYNLVFETLIIFPSLLYSSLKHTNLIGKREDV